MNNAPVIPFIFEAIGTTSVVVYGILAIYALMTVAKSATLTGGQRVVWVAAIILLPIVGALAWLATCFIERSKLRRHPDS